MHCLRSLLAAAAPKKDFHCLCKAPSRDRVEIGSNVSLMGCRTYCGSNAPAPDIHEVAVKLLKQLAEFGHVMPVKASNVEVLSSPKDFFDAVMELSVDAVIQRGVSQAACRVTIASLYIGTGDGRSNEFVTALGDAANAAATKPELRITVLLDGSRGTRSSPGPNGVPTSSAGHLRKSMFRSEASKERANLLLYQPPALQGLLKKVLPPRIREIVSVCHLKVYLFDDDVLLTGANLSNDYFNHRQDRYILIKNTKSLADRMDKFVQTMGDFSLHLTPCGDLHSPSSGVHPIKYPEQFRYGLWKRITDLMYPPNSPLYCRWAQQMMNTNKNQEQDRNPDFTEAEGDTWVVPVVQLAHFHIRQDEMCTLQCLKAMEPGGSLQLASAYLNLASPFQRALMKSPELNLEILTASPQANGFYGAKGISGFVPKAYSLVMAQLWGKLHCSDQSKTENSVRRQILEYCRKNWQFHAKGIWYTPPLQVSPIVTSVGSPNYGHRSVYRDIEAQVFLITTNTTLRHRLELEVQSLKQHCHPVQKDKIMELQKESGAAVRLAVKLMQGFL